MIEVQRVALNPCSYASTIAEGYLKLCIRIFVKFLLFSVTECPSVRPFLNQFCEGICIVRWGCCAPCFLVPHRFINDVFQRRAFSQPTCVFQEKLEPPSLNVLCIFDSDVWCYQHIRQLPQQAFRQARVQFQTHPSRTPQ